MNACEFCEPGCRRKSVNTINKAFRISIRRQVGGTKFKTPRLCIGTWNRSTKRHDYDGSVPINYCPMCGRKLSDKCELKSVVERLKMVNVN